MGLVLAATSVSACGTAPSSLPACPHVREYDKAVLNDAADELDKMPDGSVLANIMMPDYGTLRAGARA